MKGIILAGGAGTRLHPMTLATSKQLLPVYDKPMVYYPLATLISSDVRDILIITAPESAAAFRALLGDGRLLGATIEYATQPEPNGIAEALLIGRLFAGDEVVALILGDNIFIGLDVSSQIETHALEGTATVFATRTACPEQYGVVNQHADGRVEIVEKPARPTSNLVATGLYVYPPGSHVMASRLLPSKRGELEITDLNMMYAAESRLNVHAMPPHAAWFDCGTPGDLLAAGNYIAAAQARTGDVIGATTKG